MQNRIPPLSTNMRDIDGRAERVLGILRRREAICTMYDEREDLDEEFRWDEVDGHWMGMEMIRDLLYVYTRATRLERELLRFDDLELVEGG